MSAIEQVQAYNQGVRDALAQAAAAADAIEKLPNYREGRQGFASEALKAFSEVGTELLLGKRATARRRVVKECLAFALQDELGLDSLTRHSRNRSARSVNAEIGLRATRAIAGLNGSAEERRSVGLADQRLGSNGASLYSRDRQAVWAYCSACRKTGRSQTGSARARPWHGDWLGRAEGSRGCRAEWGIMALDISPDMLAIARQRAASAEANITFIEGRAEAIPADAASIDAVLASLSLMYVIDREAAAREIARVLRPGGRLVAAVWAGPERADIVLFQQTAGSFAPEPPVPGVGAGALGDPASFRAQLVGAGLKVQVETETVEFTFDNFESAWDALAAVTASRLEPERAEAAKAAVRKTMWPKGDGSRCFRNETHFIIGHRT